MRTVAAIAEDSAADSADNDPLVAYLSSEKSTIFNRIDRPPI
jgi:hypothetical protein